VILNTLTRNPTTANFFFVASESLRFNLLSPELNSVSCKLCDLALHVHAISTSNVLKLCFRRTSSNIQIKEATTIAAYVAYTHKPLRTNEVLGVRNEKLHFVLKLVKIDKIGNFD